MSVATGTGYGSGAAMLSKKAKFSASPGPRTPPIASQYGDIMNGMETWFTSYDDLVKQGRVDPRTQDNGYSWSKFTGVSGSQTRLGNDIQKFQDSLAQGDENFALYRDTVNSGLKGIESGIPDDLRRSITEQLRSSQASRGILDSSVAGIEEVVRLMGGQEAVRSQRLQQANQYFGDVTQMSLSALFPSIGQLMGGQAATDDRNLQRGQGIRQERAGYTNEGIGAAGSIVGGLLGGAM